MFDKATGGPNGCGDESRFGLGRWVRTCGTGRSSFPQEEASPPKSHRCLQQSLGIIGVGEGTVPYVVNFIHQYLGIDEHRFFQELDPVYKLGVRFTWGNRDYFDYTFSQNQWAFQAPDLGRPSGFFAQHGHHGIDQPGALMEHNHALPTRGAGFPDLPPAGNLVAWHLENQSFVA